MSEPTEHNADENALRYVAGVNELALEKGYAAAFNEIENGIDNENPLVDSLAHFYRAMARFERHNDADVESDLRFAWEQFDRLKEWAHASLVHSFATRFYLERGDLQEAGEHIAVAAYYAQEMKDSDSEGSRWKFGFQAEVFKVWTATKIQFDEQGGTIPGT